MNVVRWGHGDKWSCTAEELRNCQISSRRNMFFLRLLILVDLKSGFLSFFPFNVLVSFHQNGIVGQMLSFVAVWCCLLGEIVLKGCWTQNFLPTASKMSIKPKQIAFQISYLFSKLDDMLEWFITRLVFDHVKPENRIKCQFYQLELVLKSINL